MTNRYRVAMSFETLPSPPPSESSPGIWVYEVEAAGGDSAFAQAADLWREATHVGVGDGMPPHAVATRI
jgi:hypothetical protein